MKLAETKMLERGRQVLVDHEDEDRLVLCKAVVVCTGDERYEDRKRGPFVMVVVLLGGRFVTFPSYSLTIN